MNNLFYNIVCIIVGVILIPYGISLVKNKNKLLGVIAFVHSGLFVFFGIFGFFIPEKYGVISILAMLAFTITLIISILQLRHRGNNVNDKKKKTDKQGLK